MSDKTKANAKVNALVCPHEVSVLHYCKQCAEEHALTARGALKDKPIAIDFDGTVVTHEYPMVGKDVPGAVETLQLLNECGSKLILWTMRSGTHLADAIRWFGDNNIPLWGVQRNPDQDEWTDSPKCYAPIYIDDAALGCPLKHDPELATRPFVNWLEVRKLLGI